MFNLIYLVLGIYLIKIIVVRIKMYYQKKNNKSKVDSEKWQKIILSKIKNIFSEKNNIFIFKSNKNEVKEEVNIEITGQLEFQRHKALEKAKYKCEECGNIANLGVYEKSLNKSNEELVVLCKKCYEKSVNELKLHYEHGN